MTFEEAAAIPQSAVIALQGLRDRGRVQPGQTVLVNGGGGGAGSFAIQVARALGAEVTAVDSAEKLELMRSLGADHVIDRCYPLSETPRALRRPGEGRAKGKLVIVMKGSREPVDPTR